MCRRAGVGGKCRAIGRGEVAVVAGMDRPIPAPEDQHIGPFDRRKVDRGHAVANGVVQAVGVLGRHLDGVVVEVAPGPELDVALGEQVPVDAQAHGVANARVDRAIDKHTQCFAHLADHRIDGTAREGAIGGPDSGRS